MCNADFLCAETVRSALVYARSSQLWFTLFHLTFIITTKSTIKILSCYAAFKKERWQLVTELPSVTPHLLHSEVPIDEYSQSFVWFCRCCSLSGCTVYKTNCCLSLSTWRIKRRCMPATIKKKLISLQAGQCMLELIKQHESVTASWWWTSFPEEEYRRAAFHFQAFLRKAVISVSWYWWRACCGSVWPWVGTSAQEPVTCLCSVIILLAERRVVLLSVPSSSRSSYAVLFSSPHLSPLLQLGMRLTTLIWPRSGL